MEMQCLCTAGLEETCSFPVATCFFQTALLSPGPSSQVVVRGCLWSSIKQGLNQSGPTALPSHQTAPSASEASGRKMPLLTPASTTNATSSHFTCPSSPSRQCPPSQACSQEETSASAASSSPTLMLETAGPSPCSTSAGCLEMEQHCPATTG